MERPRRKVVEKRSHSPTGISPAPKKTKNDASVDEPGTDNSSVTASSEHEIGQSQSDLKKVQDRIEVTGIHLPSWVTVLQGVRYSGYNMEMKSSIPIPTVEVRSYCPGNLQKLKRMLGYTFLKGSSHLHNVFLSDPSNFTVKSPKASKKDKNTGRVVSRSAGSPTASFFIVGKVVDSQLTVEESAKSIALQPLGRTIDRITAFLGAVSNMNDVVLPIANQGLVFSTYRKGNSDNNDYPVSNKKPSRSSHGPDVLSWKANVPAFDGRESFKLKDYWDLNPAPGGELGDLSTAIVIFTATKYQTSSGSFRFGFNIQSAILLSDRHSTDWTRSPGADWHPSLLDESPLGVINIVPYSVEEDQPDFTPSDDDNDIGDGIL